MSTLAINANKWFDADWLFKKDYMQKFSIIMMRWI